MSMDPDRLYNLLPVIYRQRDAEFGAPLKALLAVITEQVNAVDQDITQLYDNWFIETCEDWAVPYIGDLIAYQAPTAASLPDDVSTVSERVLQSMLIPRRDVANTLTFRQRKGTRAIVEQLVWDLTGWPSHVVETDRRLSIMQALNHLRHDRGRWIDLRARRAVDRLDGAFDSAARTVRLDRDDEHCETQSNVLPALCAFVWRLKVYSLERVPAYCVQQAGERCFTFSAFGNNVPLFTRVEAGGPTSDSSRETAFPGAIGRDEFTQTETHDRRTRLRASSHYYGLGKSVAIWAPNWCDLDAKTPVPADRVIPADLSRWAYEPPAGHVAVDPELGRLAFATGELPKDGVWVSYCYGFADDIGGGPYPRRLAYPSDTRMYLVGSGAQYVSIGLALKAWEADAPMSAIIEVIDSEVYAEQLRIHLKAGQSLVMRAANGARPVIDIIGPNSNRPEMLAVSGAADSAFGIDGILIFGRALEIKGPLARFSMCDCTLVPGWGRENDPVHLRRNEPSLIFIDTRARISIRRSILGAMRVIRTEADVAAADCLIERSIIDATGPEAVAISGEEGRFAGIVATIKTSTILGEALVHAIASAENSIFTGVVRVARRQRGCLRYCYLPIDSQVPSRYQCQPGSEQRGAEPLAAERRRVKPEFVSTRYGAPGYCKLADACAMEIKRGAEDRSELGVFHDLFEPQRQDLLVASLADFVPLGTESGVVCVD